ncbi:helix-turn-helix domain-containing protein [Streptomyces sp. MS19]|uniref:helix-turn-helix domain-containing protein n=1 Tax=Streptomyces sp. MS19 TaxID=3385972 RepID=UPI00399F632C
MPESPSSAAQSARLAVGRRLKEMRLDAGLTVTELARRCGWHHAKTSRIENARTSPSVADIRAWCAACGFQHAAADLVAANRTAESMYTEWRRTMRTGLRHLQESYTSLFEQTTLFRAYSSRIVPGLLQTEGYATALLRGVARLHNVPDDSAAAAAARMERSRVLHRPGRRAVLLIEESVLQYQLGDATTMAAQFGHLLTAGALPAVSLGIIPVGLRERPIRPLEAFHVYDDILVAVELLSARVTVTEPSDVALYLKAFQDLTSLAVYGADARALILKALTAL